MTIISRTFRPKITSTSITPADVFDKSVFLSTDEILSQKIPTPLDDAVIQIW